MNRLQTKLDQLDQAHRKALVSYVVAGDPSQSETGAVLHELVKSGTDIIELGVPFSDPSADGPVIQLAHERALANHIGMSEVFEIVSAFREADQETPIVLMGYANPVEWMGYSNFCQRAVEAGVDGVLIVDIPPEEAKEINSVLTEHDLCNVFLVAPTTSDQRIQAICSYASGFLYYVSLKGVTGSGKLDIDSVEARLADIRTHTDLPVYVGFGIKTPENAAAVSKISDGVVVGSAIVELLANKESSHQAVNELASDMRAAIDNP